VVVHGAALRELHGPGEVGKVLLEQLGFGPRAEAVGVAEVVKLPTLEVDYLKRQSKPLQVSDYILLSSERVHTTFSKLIMAR
jgi:hypothetical protein